MKKVKLFSSKDHCWKERETKWPNSALRPPKLEHNAFHFFISKFSYNVFWSNYFSFSKLFQDLPLHFMFFHSFQNKSVCICFRTRVHVLEHTHIHTQMQERKQKPMSPFYVSQLLLRFRLVLNVVDTPILLTLKRSDFPMPTRYHLRTVSCLGVGICDHLPSSVLGFCVVWICACLLHIVRVSMSSYL